MHKVYERPVLIRFAHCDPAGIVFHPQYITIVNGVVEDFFRDVVKVPFVDIMRQEKGLPVVGIRCDFMAPSRPGDECTARLWIERMGESSVTFACQLFCGNEERMRLVETMVSVSDENNTLKSMPLDESVRAAFAPYVRDPEATPLKLRS